MKIVACIKNSLDVAEIKVNHETKEINLAGVPKRLGVIDKNILEEAVSLQEQYGGSSHGVSFVSQVNPDTFREALAFGLDDLTMIEDPADGQYGPMATAFVLAKAIEKIGDVDIVVFGEVSDDGFTYQVPTRVSEILGIPIISYIREISLEDSKVTAKRELDDFVQTVSTSLPVIISVTEETNTPRRPTLMDALKAKKKPVNSWNLQTDLAITEEMLNSFVMWNKEKTEGIVIERKQQILKGDKMDLLAKQLLENLENDNVIGKGGN